jgi:hypothetical protein
MDKKKLADKAAQAGNWLANTALDAVAEAKQRHEDDFFNEGYDNGRADQREFDVEAAIMAFLELKVKDHEIYKLLSEYFCIDSISEASERLLSAKKTRQIRALKKHCLNQGMSIRDFRSYSKEHNLEERLIEDERLLEMSPEKLKSTLDRD